MAQITTDKRSTQMMRPHTTAASVASATSSATKENTARNHAAQARGKGIEILDFHESWLEEVELYKDKLVTCKQLSHHNHQSSHPSSHQSSHHNNYNAFAPTRLSPHMRTVGGHTSSVATANQAAAAAAAVTVAATATTAVATKLLKGQMQKTSQLSHRRSKLTDASSASVASSVPAKSLPARILPKLNTVPAPVVGVLQSEPYKKVQVRRLNLKLNVSSYDPWNQHLYIYISIYLFLSY